ncbi:MAG: dienelactone hydrolase family protein [Roseivirga sp.]
MEPQEVHKNIVIAQPMSRGSFLKRTALLAGGLALSPQLIHGRTSYSKPLTSSQGLTTDIVYYQGADSYMKCFMARPETSEPLPGLMLIHENRGLNRHIIDITKRAAMEGYHVIAPDALSPIGGTLEEFDENRTSLKKLDPDQTLENFRRGLAYLQNLTKTTDKTAILGFCWGAGLANQLAVKSKHVDAVVAYYGPQPPIEAVKDINAPLLLHYAELDDNINEGVPEFRKALFNHGIKFRIEMHSGVDHYFNNPTMGSYNKIAAKKAWKQTFQFLNKHLVT